MQLSHFVRALGLFLVLAVLGSAFGCGSEAEQNAMAARDDNGLIIANKGFRALNKKQRESAKANPGGRKVGKSQAKSEP